MIFDAVITPSQSQEFEQKDQLEGSIALAETLQVVGVARREPVGLMMKRRG